MKGRKPKDPALKVLTGNPGKRPVSVEQDAPFVKAPFAKPQGLDPVASREWDRLVETLDPILSPASAGMVLIAADAFSEWQAAAAILAKEGSTYITQNQHEQEMIRQRPEVVIRNNARRAYHQALAELGASPVSHARVKRLPFSQQTELPGLRRLLG